MRKRKIFIVDDNESFRKELTEALELNGFSVTSLAGDESVISHAAKLQPDLILLDLKMNRLSGFKIADELNKLPETSKIPVVAVTGVYTKKEHQLLMRVCKIRECLLKPVDPERIVNIVNTLS